MTGRFLIIGDVHAVFAPFERAVQYARQHNLTLISVGDLVDNNQEGDLVVNLMLDEVRNRGARLTWGNHEWKVWRWAKGNNVHVAWPTQVTLDHFDKDPGFQATFMQLMEHAETHIDDSSMLVCHAGVLPKFWETGVVTNRIRDVFMYSTTDNSRQVEFRGQMYPVRTYGWTEHVPAGRTVFVGHDPRPFVDHPIFDQFQLEPTVFTNSNGGTSVFLDCGCGKGGDLWGAVVEGGQPVDFVNFGR
jgi:protein phosphatase